jgi:hypothetical protein
MENQIDKIVLSKGKDFCAVHLINGTVLHFNFFKLGMTYIEGLAWIENDVLKSVNNWGKRERSSTEVELDEQTRILKVA